jgi:hypothetical protein
LKLLRERPAAANSQGMGLFSCLRFDLRAISICILVEGLFDHGAAECKTLSCNQEC